MSGLGSPLLRGKSHSRSQVGNLTSPNDGTSYSFHVTTSGILQSSPKGVALHTGLSKALCPDVTGIQLLSGQHSLLSLQVYCSASYSAASLAHALYILFIVAITRHAIRVLPFPCTRTLIKQKHCSFQHHRYPSHSTTPLPIATPHPTK